jgi:hypothetical protein
MLRFHYPGKTRYDIVDEVEANLSSGDDNVDAFGEQDERDSTTGDEEEKSYESD